MKQPRIVILRGKPTAGKSTAWHALGQDKRMKDFIFIDFAKKKGELGKDEAKKWLFEELKQKMLTGKDIIIEEMSEETLRKYIDKEIEENEYKILVFQFEISIETAHKRNFQRAEEKWHPLMEKEKLEELHKMHEEKFDKNAILVDCNKLDKEQVVELIIKKLEQN